MLLVARNMSPRNMLRWCKRGFSIQAAAYIRFGQLKCVLMT